MNGIHLSSVPSNACPSFECNRYVFTKVLLSTKRFINSNAVVFTVNATVSLISAPLFIVNSLTDVSAALSRC